jgi:hypothetical protein
MRFALASSLLLLLACGSDDSTTSDTRTVEPAASSSPAPGDAAAPEAEAATDDCTSQGYECHPNPTCNAEYMPLSGISCGATGGYCCIKGAMPPSK